MRITRIDFEGKPGHYATVQRRLADVSDTTDRLEHTKHILRGHDRQTTPEGIRAHNQIGEVIGICEIRQRVMIDPDPLAIESYCRQCLAG